MQRHLEADWQSPIHPGSRAAFAAFLAGYRPERALILDSGCGTGASSARLADLYPAAEVVGIDQSAHRLARAPSALPVNLRLFRARAEDFWRLLLNARIRPAQHVLLYPNPWPKPAHLGRRWHGHPVFPTLLALSGRIELRCNWAIYAEEFAIAARLCGAVPSGVVSFCSGNPLTPFEKKYSDSGHPLFRCIVSTDACGRTGARTGPAAAAGSYLRRMHHEVPEPEPAAVDGIPVDNHRPGR